MSTGILILLAMLTVIAVAVLIWDQDKEMW